MKRKMAWFSANILLVAALLLVSCGPKAATSPAPTPVTTPAIPTPAQTPVKPTLTPAIPTPAATSVAEKPKYGGTISIIRATVTEVFDSAAVPRGMGDITWIPAIEQFVSYDWAKGLAGTGEIDFGTGVTRFEGFTRPSLAESWETPEIGTWILHIRRGVHFALDPASEASRLVNGREFTADDAVWNVRRYTIDPAFPNAGMRISQTAMAKAVTIEKTGPWEVTLKTPVDPWTGFFWVVWGGNSQHMFAREVIEKYGNADDWRRVVGTGPYMLTDYVGGSVATLKRNPNYWDKNPVGPGKGDQLPYVDGVKMLFISDVSTRLAVMRTGRGDWVTDIEWEDAANLIKTNPRILYKRLLPGGLGIEMRVDKADLPFKDKRVRQALMMATDFEAMKNDFYKGQAEILIYPVPPNYDYLHVSMEELPESVQSLYKYNPQKAKQLLAEAGYPNGFKTKIIVQNISTAMDPAAVFKAMWAKAGIDLEIQPRETAVYQSILNGTEEEMKMTSVGTTLLTSIFALSGFRRTGVFSMIDDPRIEATSQEMQKYVFINMPKVEQLYRSLVPYIMEQAYHIPRPTPYSYTFWQPWVKNHNGEIPIYSQWAKYVWIDQDLKEKMTGRR